MPSRLQVYFQLIALYVIIFTTGASPSSEVDFAGLDVHAASLESKPLHFSWSFRFCELQFDRATEKEIVPLHDTSVSGSVRFEGKGGRHRVLVSGTSTWASGMADFVSYIRGFSYEDGKYRSWVKFQHGKSVPQLQSAANETVSPTVGSISEDNKEVNLLQALMMKAGIEFLPIHFRKEYEPRFETRSSFISSVGDRELMGVSVDGDRVILHMEVASSPFVKGSDKTEFVDYEFDKSKGYVLSSVKGYYGDVNRKTLFKETHIENKEWGEGVWGPSTVLFLNYHSQLAAVTLFDDQDVVEDVPENFYALSFPKGTEIDDYVNKMSYIASGLPSSDEEKVKLFLKRHVQDYPDFTTTPLTRSPNSSSWRWIVIGVINVSVFALLACGIIRRRLRSKGGSAAMIVIVALLTERSVATYDFCWKNSVRQTFMLCPHVSL